MALFSSQLLAYIGVYLYLCSRINSISAMSMRLDEFEKRMDELLEEFTDISYEELADSLEYYADAYRAKANRDNS